MIARAQGQIVLVDGAVPGERVLARIERVAKGVVYADTVTVEEPSPDRTAEFADRLCGGCLYAHIAYPRQLEIKSLVIADAFARIARLPLPADVGVEPSPQEGYRMRARLHYQGRELGFFREGTHQVCDARATRQLLPSTCDVLDLIGRVLAGLPLGTVREVELSENLDASQRVVHVDASSSVAAPWADLLSSAGGVTGVILSDSTRGTLRVVAGSPYVSDVLPLRDQAPIALRRHAAAFFQGNRFLLGGLVLHVTDQIPRGSRLVDLYAGGGVFAVAAAQLCRAEVTAVEGDRVAAEDLAVNAAAAEGEVVAVHQSVETFAASAPPGADVVVVDPPRTGLSREAARGIVRMRAGRLVYVSCDVATLARDARRLVDGGYQIGRVDAFDLFPNTPHVEAVVVFDRRG